jgi:exopolyphosphatase/guanosine-5'-triphosphate,3'-diphosphate pyrophosphatase
MRLRGNLATMSQSIEIAARTTQDKVRAAKPVAVIDIGTSSIRMAIAEIDDAGSVRLLETLSQAVNLGKDTFTKGAITKSTIEESVRALKSYRRVLKEYQIVKPDQMRVVATSAVREATNRLAFVDRIFIATGIEVEPIDEAEVNRMTFLGIQPFLKSEEILQTAKTIVTEVGGGSTELLMVQGGDVTHSHTYRLGSLRLRKMLEAYRAPSVKVRNIMESQIRKIVAQILQHVPPGDNVEMIALGGDVRFAASRLLPQWQTDRLGKLELPELERLTDKVLTMSVDELARKYHLTFPDAETLGPALLAYVQLAGAYKLKRILITKFNLRDGLLKEMAAKQAWTEDFINQMIRSALPLGRKFDFDEPHARHVAELSKMLFQQLRDEHQLDPRYQPILYIAALLHEIGLFVSNLAYHKHSMYLINNSELFGLSRKDVLLVALVARYHRRASPKSDHEGYAMLDRERRIAVAKMAALLRVADAMDDSRSQRIQEIHCKSEDDRIVISIVNVEDLSLEQLALRQNGSLFEEIFGVPVVLRKIGR